MDPIDVEKQRRREELGQEGSTSGRRPAFNVVPKKPGLLDPDCGKRETDESFVGEAMEAAVLTLFFLFPCTLSFFLSSG